MASSGASAGPALVFEPYNGTVFYAEDPDAQWFPASLTKLMTAYVAFQALKAGTVTPDTKLICSKEATEQAPSKLWLKVGESITLDVALKGHCSGVERRRHARLLPGTATAISLTPTRIGGGSAAKASTQTGGTGASSGPSQSVFINVQGKSRFTADEVNDLMEQLIERQRDGDQLVLVR